MRDAPFFSIIIPTYNRKEFLKITINSVLQQTFDNFELIIVDDGSSDYTHDFVKGLSDKRIVYEYQENRGVSAARNRGIKLSRGDWVVFLDSDDKFVPEKLFKTFEFINQFPAIKVFHTEELWYRSGKFLNQKKKHKKPDGDVYLKVLPICCISISTIVLHKNIFEDIGLFDESLISCEDYDFLLRLTCKYKVKLIEKYLTIKDGGRSDQLSAQPCFDKYRIEALIKILNAGMLNKNEQELTVQELSKKAKIFVKGAKRRGKLQEVKQYEKFIL
ncbi:hypothetical protein MNBD_UNCLBAC01-1348 [hydrothermal vent metagenome]|uniref:Glycosyltransferase 2-like domain-containing protein n=1 Tax=hydrothermal vent metagenome TaxID=652676 RepID=A0A3B1DBG1_9ZZZZ